ncbi:hypothetical protein GCM10018953_56120 [Streptosporangium nondiastaticum]
MTCPGVAGSRYGVRRMAGPRRGTGSEAADHRPPYRGGRPGSTGRQDTGWSGPPGRHSQEEFVTQRQVTVEAEVGLHARPAATFVQTAAKAPLDITIAKGSGKPVNAKSILSVLSLDVRKGDIVVIAAEGDGADEILDRLAEIASAP